MNSEFEALNPDQRTAVEDAIALVRAHGGRRSISLRGGGEAYAYPHPGGGVSWGFNRGSDGFNIARGVVEG
jgi:hypothetical protein